MFSACELYALCVVVKHIYYCSCRCICLGVVMCHPLEQDAAASHDSNHTLLQIRVWWCSCYINLLTFRLRILAILFQLKRLHKV
jgi:hypothetical protein